MFRQHHKCVTCVPNQLRPTVHCQPQPTLHHVTDRIQDCGRSHTTANNYGSSPILIIDRARKEGICNWPSRNNYVRKSERPTIALDSSMDTKGRYKEMCQLMGPAIIWNKLKTACTSELNRLLFDLLGAKMLNSITEEQLIQHIRPVMVR